MRLFRLLVPVALSAICGILPAQTPPKVPNQVHFCGPLHCMTLNWDGGRYVVRSDDGQVTSTWTVDKFTKQMVVIHRFESNGFSAVYRGQISNQGDTLTNVTLNNGPANGVAFTWGPALHSIPGSDAERAGVMPNQHDASASAATVQSSPGAETSDTVSRQSYNVSPPDIMHFCASNCMTLTFNNGQYVSAYTTTGPEVTQIWIVKSFSPESVVLERTDSDGFAAVFKGQISADRSRLVNVSINGVATPTVYFTWGDALTSIPGSNAERDKLAVLQGNAIPHNALTEAAASVYAEYSKPHPEDIIMPPGADPEYASFPPEMRAILRQSALLPPGGDKAACKDAAKFSDEEAMEIGKFAYRAAEFDRANCWMKLLADKGNDRASIIIGVAKVMGWGMPRDLEGAFNIFKYSSDNKPDIWAPYLLAECYQYGYGTPVNRAEAAHLNALLMSVPAGQQINMLVGSDDRRMVANFKKSLNMLYTPAPPAQGYRRECDSEGITCHDVLIATHPVY